MKSSGDKSLTYDDVVMGRRSTRGYKSDPVPLSLIREIISMAVRAPSSYNTQPWHFYVVTGTPLDSIRAENTERILAGIEPHPELNYGSGYTGVHRERQIGVAKQLFGAMGIARENVEKRQDWIMRGFRQFDAPVSIIVTCDAILRGTDVGPFDCGSITNALVNAAWSRGLGCVINNQGSMNPSVVRKHAGITDDQTIMVCVAMGWPDENFPANQVISERKPLDETVVFVGFEEQGPVS